MLHIAAKTIALVLIGGSLCSAAGPQWCPTREDAASLRRFEYSQIHMGTRVDLVLFAPSESVAEKAAKAAFAKWAELEQIMSDYRPDSELMKLCAQAGKGPVRVSKDLFTVLERSAKVSELSDGAFDITCGPVVKLWREARRTGKLPPAEAIAEARKLVGWKHVILNKRNRTAEIDLPGVKLDLGGIAKGYAGSQAIEVLKRHGIERAMVEGGGDLAIAKAPPGKRGWQIAIRGHEGKPLVLENAAVSTSGDSEQFVEIEGVRYSHIVDPRTGIGLTNRVQASVIARNGLTTDPLATALCVLGPEKGNELARRERVRVVWVVGPVASPSNELSLRVPTHLWVAFPRRVAPLSSDLRFGCLPTCGLLLPEIVCRTQATSHPLTCVPGFS